MREWALQNKMPGISLEGLGADHQTRFATVGGFLSRGLAVAATREGNVTAFTRLPKGEAATLRARRKAAMRLRERGQPRSIAEAGAAVKVPLLQLEEFGEICSGSKPSAAVGMHGAITAGCDASLGMGPEATRGILLATHTGAVSLVTLSTTGLACHAPHATFQVPRQLVDEAGGTL